MAPQRVSATELARLLNSAPQPIYVLDDELTIVFINRACQEWLGAAAEDLVGRRCAYHSDPGVAGPDAVAAGLCPPPRVSAGEAIEATVGYPGEDGKQTARKARFLPFGGGGDDVLGIFALVDTGEQLAAGVEGKLAEPDEPDATELHERIRRFRQEAAGRYRADGLIGLGPEMQLVQRQVVLAAESRSSVLLVGPPGSGRQQLASVIHYAAEKGDSPHYFPVLAPLDCSLLGADLLGEVLAAAARTDILDEQAMPGTLLFHRVDELSAEVQAELAGLLTRRPPAQRLMATAAKPLDELAPQGKFREDLAALLSTIVIRLPALAKRRDDLPLLAQLFLEDRNAAGSRQIGGFTPAALDRLAAYAWPGNLDELAQVVAESHQRAAGREIDVADLPDRLHWAAQAAAIPRRVEETIVLDEYLGRVERELIRRALAKAKGNKARAARLLGMTRPRLYRRMMQLGLE
jgi:transcriptional regulator with PAS, ATPase and Fis domain